LIKSRSQRLERVNIDMSNIRAIKAREVLDSQGLPTLQIFLWIDDGRSVVVYVPNEWNYENPKAFVNRDNDEQEFAGKGVKNAVNNINLVIAPQLLGKSCLQQGEFDKSLLTMDGTNNKSKLGTNVLLGLSMAVLKAGALSTNLPLYSYVQQKYQLTDFLTTPSCIYPLINGGDFGNDNLDFQEFELIPASHIDFQKSITMASTLKEKIKEVIESKGGSVCTGPLGGYLPRMNSNSEVYELLLEAIKATHYTFAQDVFFGLDAAADDIVIDDHYKLRDKPDRYNSSDLLKFYLNLRERYKTIYLEDPFFSEDQKSWQKITDQLGDTTKIVGDEFIRGDREKLQKAIKDKICNTLSIKLLDFGTVSETIQAAKVAKQAQWSTVVADHSGETNETLIVDLAVGIGADYVKFGPPNRGERIAKYNRMIEINEEIDVPEQAPQQNS